MKHKGISQHRFKENPEERRFAEAWEKHNTDGKTLAYLLDPNSGTRGGPPPPSDRDREVAATVLQWLGSPVGHAFLADLGYEKAGR